MGFLSWPYVEGSSAWGDMTSTIRFCEVDFYLTPYIAEFVNTITSATYLYLGWAGMQNTRHYGGDRVVIMCYALLAFVGPGSMAYHVSIKYTGQMIDEFSMLYATAAILYAALSITLEPESRVLFGYGVALNVIVASLIHYCLDYTILFRYTFASMVFTTFLQCVWLLNIKIKDQRAVAEMKHLAVYGAVSFVAGYILWNIDNHSCTNLRHIRDVVGMPLGFLTELHGWWHILTGLGVYYYVVFIEYLRLCITIQDEESDKRPQVLLVWRSVVSLPHLAVLRSRATKSHLHKILEPETGLTLEL